MGVGQNAQPKFIIRCRVPPAVPFGCAGAQRAGTSAARWTAAVGNAPHNGYVGPTLTTPAIVPAAPTAEHRRTRAPDGAETADFTGAG